MKSKNKLRSNPSRLASVAERVNRSASWRDDKASSAQRGYGYEWQQARRDYLREHPFCRMCRDRGQLVAATHVDHIRPHCGDQSLFWDRSNWQGLCAHCHCSVKQRQERAEYAGSKRQPAIARRQQRDADEAGE